MKCNKASVRKACVRKAYKKAKVMAIFFL